jgi:hypothetical protein
MLYFVKYEGLEWFDSTMLTYRPEWKIKHSVFSRHGLLASEVLADQKYKEITADSTCSGAVIMLGYMEGQSADMADQYYKSMLHIIADLRGKYGWRLPIMIARHEQEEHDSICARYRTYAPMVYQYQEMIDVQVGCCEVIPGGVYPASCYRTGDHHYNETCQKLFAIELGSAFHSYLIEGCKGKNN